MPRLFLAIDLPDRLREGLATSCLPLRGRFSGARWTKEDNLHITVAFFGHVGERDVPALRERLRDALADHDGFSMDLVRLVMGPPKGEPRMIWALFAPEDPFSDLVRMVRERCIDWFERPSDVKRAVPHVTVARFRREASVQREELPQPGVKTGLEVRSCSLYASILRPDGPVYEALEEINLKE